jgi:hypothetical protein
MTADEIAAQLRDALAKIRLPLTMQDYDAHPMRLALIDAKVALPVAARANSLEGALDKAVDAIIALEAAEAEARRAVEYWTRIMAECTHSVARTREALRVALTECGDPGTVDARGKHHVASLRGNGAKSAEITDEKALPDDCFRTKREPDKALIKARLARGEEIPGAALRQAPPSLVITSKEK